MRPQSFRSKHLQRMASRNNALMVLIFAKLEIKVSQLVPGESFPTRLGTRPGTESVKQSPDFCNRKPGFPGQGDGGQAELCVRRKIALAVLAESWWNKSCLFVKTDGRRA